MEDPLTEVGDSITTPLELLGIFIGTFICVKVDLKG